MLSYVVRRLLYSVVVLLATSFLVFTFVSVSGDPLAALRVTPDYDPNTIKRIEEENNLDKPVPVRYVYWLKDAVRGRFRHDAARRPADPARSLAGDEEHVDARLRCRGARGSDRRR